MVAPRRQFIAVEGIDGSGTTLQTRTLARWLRQRGHEVVETREPSAGTIGRLIRERLQVESEPLDPAALALLFAADRLDHVAREIDPARRRGALVVSDRYLLSSLAYQSLDCDLAWVRTINHAAPPPDLYIFLRVPAEVAFARVQQRTAAGASTTERFDALTLQQKIARLYETALGTSDLGEIEIVDGTPSADEVSQAITEVCVRHGL